MRVPLVPPALTFIAGLATASIFPVSSRWGWLALGGLLLGGLIALLLGRHRVAALLVIGSLIPLGALRYQHAARVPLPPHIVHLASEGERVVEGVVAGEPIRSRPGTVRFNLAVERLVVEAREEPAEGLIQVTLANPATEVETGERLRMPLRLSRPRAYRNPGGFDYGAWLAREGIYVVATGKGNAVVRLGREEGNVKAWFATLRRKAIAAMATHLPPRSAGLLQGLILGERRHLPQDLDEAFRRAGVYHVLAVSGFNVAVLAVAVYLTLGFLGLPRRAVAAVSLAVIVGFAFLVGGSPSVVRATIMAGLFLTGAILGRESAPMNTLAAAALVILVWHPLAVLDVGLQLSFVATAGLIYLTSPFDRWLGSLGLPRWLGTLLAASAAAQLAVTPIMAVHFNQTSTLGVLANILVVPLSGLATILGVAGLAAEVLWDSLAGWIFLSSWWVLLLLRWMVKAIATIPWALLHPPTPPILLISALYTLLLLLPQTGRGRLWRLGTVGTGLVAVGLTALLFWPAAPGKLRVVFLDVGQGDATFIELPGGTRLLVDGGRGPGLGLDIGERVIAPFLWQQGIYRLDAVVMTRAHPEQAGGLEAIVRGFRVREFWEAGTLDGEPGLEGLRRALGVSRVPRRILSRGERIWLDGAVLTVLHPPPSATPDQTDAGRERNGGSLALRLDHGLASILLTSWQDGRDESEWLRLGLPVRSLLLKVPGHGAHGSTTRAFLRETWPHWAVISVGRNWFGHPAPQVLARLVEAGTSLYRTDRDGAVIVEIDGRGVRLIPWGRRSGKEWLGWEGSP